jgi:uncharacterized DUF497 family protein
VTITGYLWLEEIIDKLEWKHNVSAEEVEELFGNTPHFRFVEKGHRPGENVYAALAQTDAGRYLVAFFVHKADGRAMVISAREMNEAERRQYERK